MNIKYLISAFIILLFNSCIANKAGNHVSLLRLYSINHPQNNRNLYGLYEKFAPEELEKCRVTMEIPKIGRYIVYISEKNNSGDVLAISGTYNSQSKMDMTMYEVLLPWILTEKVDTAAKENHMENIISSIREVNAEVDKIELIK